VLSGVEDPEEAPDPNNATEFIAWHEQYGITRLTILLMMERSMQQQYGVQKEAKALWDQWKEEYELMVKLNKWALRDEMSAVKLRDCEDLQEYASKPLGYVNNFDLCAESSTGTMPKSEHSYYLLQAIRKDVDWRFFAQLMYDRIDTLANEPKKIVTTIKAHKV